MSNTLKTALEASAAIYLDKPGQAGAFPRRTIAEDAACKPLRDIHAREQVVSAERAKIDQELDALRTAALTLQEGHHADVESLKALQAHIALRASELARSHEQMKEIESAFEHAQPGQMFGTHIDDYTKRAFLVARLPGWLERARAKADALTAKIAEFRKVHGIQ